jgi:hypothetical protein
VARGPAVRRRGRGSMVDDEFDGLGSFSFFSSFFFHEFGVIEVALLSFTSSCTNHGPCAF